MLTNEKLNNFLVASGLKLCSCNELLNLTETFILQRALNYSCASFASQKIQNPRTNEYVNGNVNVNTSKLTNTFTNTNCE